MMPVGPLMIEHRLIERMIALMGKEVQRIEQGLAPDTEFIRTRLISSRPMLTACTTVKKKIFYSGIWPKNNYP
jgi:hypothetical protein